MAKGVQLYSSVFQQSAFWIIVVWLSLTLASTNAFKWETSDERLQCTHVFRRSIREDSRIGQTDPLFIWLGKPSKALHVGGRHGPIPMPSVWAHFVNMLYISDCQHSDSMPFATAVSIFLQQWMTVNPLYKDRKLFLSGAMDDTSGGSEILAIAQDMIKLDFPLSGLVIGNPTFTPSVMFFRHKSFEQSNNMTFWSVDRARQPIVCNGKFTQVEFWLHDLHLMYTPSEPLESLMSGSVEYKLSAINSFDRCYTGDRLSEFERVWGGSRPLPPHEEVYPTFPHEIRGEKVDPFTRACDSDYLQDSNGGYPPGLRALVAAGIPLVLYSQLYQNPKAICSFYIGIFEADATRLPPLTAHMHPQTVPAGSSGGAMSGRGRHVSDWFSRAPLERMDSAFSHEGSSADSIALIQDGTSAHKASTDGECLRGSGQSSGHSCGHQGLVWIQIDDRYGISGKGSKRSPPLSRATAVDILAYALGKYHQQENSEILEYVDLLI
jgi:hypothetical protein